MTKEKVLIGAGGFAREVKAQMKMPNMKCFVDDEYYVEGNGEGIYPLSDFDSQHYSALIVIGNPKLRYEMLLKLPSDTEYFSFVHESAIVLGDDVKIGTGVMICAGCILTTNIVLGDHSHLNLATTIGHDCRLGSFFTTAPGAKVSGNCIIGDRVYVGTNASIREKLEIGNDVTFGLNAGVVKNTLESGVYAGTPAKKINAK